MWELISGLRALRDPARAALHLPWVNQALPIARKLDLEGALALTPTDGYMADFITPPPSGPLASFDEELEIVRRTSVKQIRIDVELLVAAGRDARSVERFRTDPRREVDRMCLALREFWALALEPHWSRLRLMLQDDLRYRAGRLTEGGPSRLFADLHPDVSWRGDRLDIDLPWCEDRSSLDGCGLLLVPSAFQATVPAAIVEEPWQPTLVYPARGVALLWEQQHASGSEALRRLIGVTRSRLLVSLGSPRSTTELSRALGVSAGGVSQHLSVLRDSGLVRSQREGRSVLYMRTELADALIV